MSWDYRLAHQALKNLKRFPPKDQERIVATLEGMKEHPFGGDLQAYARRIKFVSGRIGNYRIYFRPRATDRFLDIPEITRRQSH